MPLATKYSLSTTMELVCTVVVMVPIGSNISMFGHQGVALFERIRKIGNHLLEEVFN